MTHRLLVSVAAVALLAGSGLANAQSAGADHNTPSAGATTNSGSSATEHGAASGSSEMNQHGSTGTTSPSSGERMDHGNQRAEDKTSPEGHKGRQAQDNMKQNPSKSMRSETNENGKADRENMKAEDHGRMGSDRNAAESHSSHGTVGQAGAGAKLSTEQRTRITTVIRNEHVQPAMNVNFSVSVGARVPRTVGFHPLPEDIVTIYPNWRGYEFFLVRDQIVVVDPRSLEIVAVLNA